MIRSSKSSAFILSSGSVRLGHMTPCFTRLQIQCILPAQGSGNIIERKEGMEESGDGVIGNKMTSSDHGTSVSFEFRVGLSSRVKPYLKQ